MINDDKDIVKNEKIIELNSKDYLDKAFPDGIPCNTIINKGRCGIGGTTLELKSKRHSIIIVPNIPTIESKMTDYPSIIGVYGGITKQSLNKQLQDCLNDGVYIKVLSTPDSFQKLVHACQDLEFDLYKECFLLLDEYHTIITELGYRENMIKPLDFLFEFENKALISATPFGLSDPRFTQFTRINIISEHLNKDVNVVFSEDIYGVLISFIEQARSIPNSNVHLFYNSVKSIVEVVNLLKEKEDINIFCANTKENRGKLGNLKDLFAQLGHQDFKKINFYTTKYNEGWDLHDENAFIVLVSDVNLQQTCFHIEIKGTQAIGRLRNKAKGVYHITNYRNINIGKMIDIVDDIKNDAQSSISAFNYINKNFSFTNEGNGFLDSLKRRIEEYGDVNKTDYSAIINYNKVDSKIYLKLTNCVYNDKEAIITAWQKGGFNPKSEDSNIQLSAKDRKMLFNNRIGKSKKNRCIVDKIEHYKTYCFLAETATNGLSIDFGGVNEYQKLIDENPCLYRYYTELGYSKMKELNFSSSKMEKAYLLQTSNKLEVSKELKNYVYSTFYCGKKYPSSVLKKELSKIYGQFNVPKKVTASDITKYFIADGLTYRFNGEPVKGYILQSKI